METLPQKTNKNTKPAQDLNETSEFSNSLFLVAGGSTGMGLSVATELARKHARLILLARRPEELEKAKQQCLAEGALEVVCAPLDLTHAETPQKVRNIVGAQKLRGLLLNGGGPHGIALDKLSLEDFLQANLLLLAGPALLLSAVMPCLENGVGSVVAITSTTVKQPNSALPLSAAYRTGFVALLKNFADALAPRGVRVNNVAPGYTTTEQLNHLRDYVAIQKYGDAGPEHTAKVMEEWAHLAPLGRTATPREIARICLFLFSSESGFITGQTLVADGGQMRSY